MRFDTVQVVVLIRLKNRREQGTLLEPLKRRIAIMTQKILLVCLVFGMASLLPISMAQDSPSNESSYLLLNNGNVIKGLVQYEKDRVSVVDEKNSNLYIASKQVLYIGPNLESLYQFQRSSVRQWGTGEHWQLAHWCIQQNLLSHAIEHFQVVEQSAKDSPNFKQLEHALRQALSADDRVQRLIQSRMQTDSETTNEPAQSNAVVRASVEFPNEKVPKPTREELESSDSWNKHEIPSYIRRTFQTSILPVLVSRCGQTGCHGALGKSDFHIYQPLGEKSSILLTRDLDEVLRYVDRDNVQQSALVVHATSAHGIQRNPSLNASRTDERVLIERIQSWVKSLALSKMPESTMPLKFPVVSAVGSEVKPAVANVPTSNATVRNPRRFTQEEEDRNAKLSKPAKPAAPTEFLSMSEIAELEKAIEKFEKKAGVTDSQSNKKDPFAPDVFNRKYR